jgi:predicted dehydrogenase
MTKPLRWGILGAAKFARDHMAPAIHAARNAELVALATSDPARAAPFAAFAPGLKIHTSYDDLLADTGIDAVYIPLPNHLHVAWTLKALAAGKHVLCEKPISLTAPEIAPIIAARDAFGLLAAEAFMIVHHPQWQRAQHLVQSGAIGAVTHVDGVFTYDNRADPGNIRNKPETGGGGIYDIGVYTYGSARFVTGAEPVALDAVMRQ